MHGAVTELYTRLWLIFKITVLLHFRMPTKGNYVAGRQVSRWDTESDNVDIQYRHFDNRESPGLAEFFAGKKGTILKVLLLFVCFLIGLIIGYIIRRNIHEKYISPSTDSSPVTVSSIYQVIFLAIQSLTVYSKFSKGTFTKGPHRTLCVV